MTAPRMYWLQSTTRRVHSYRHCSVARRSTRLALLATALAPDEVAERIADGRLVGCKSCGTAR